VPFFVLDPIALERHCNCNPRRSFSDYGTTVLSVSRHGLHKRPTLNFRSRRRSSTTVLSVSRHGLPKRPTLNFRSSRRSSSCNLIFFEIFFVELGLVGDTTGVAGAEVKKSIDCAFGLATFDAPLLLHFLRKSHQRTTA
jgi:hypothetical protein